MPAVPSLRSSGDLIADRRYAYAKAAFDEKDFGAAVELARQALELAPHFAAAHALVGRASAALGETGEALHAFERCLELEPDDALGVGIDLARLGAMSPEAAISPGYVRALFDDYAPQFDRHLVKKLAYRGPELIRDALRWCCAKRARPFRFRRAFDLGCGTGLVARALAGTAEAIEGVDLSPRMLAMAARTRLYDKLHEGDLASFLAARDAGEADLVVAADVFVYMASLDNVFRGVHRVLKRSGFFAFTVQAWDGEGVELGEDARYAHGEAHLRALAQATALPVVSFGKVSTRQDRGEDVPGFLVVLER